MVNRLREICPVWVNIISIEDNFQMITDFGQLLMLVQKPEEWNDKLTCFDFRNFVHSDQEWLISFGNRLWQLVLIIL
jgi:hypothetical protein